MKNILLVVYLAVASILALRGIKTKFHTRIVGGTEARRGEFPSIVQIREGEDHSCAGSIINPNYIVTAAHCTHDLDLSLYTIVAGQHNLNKTEGTEQFRTVTQIKNHPKHETKFVSNDISLMKLNSPLKFNANVAKATLATSDPTGNVITAGWGVLFEGSYSGSAYLMKVTVPMITQAKCRESYGKEKMFPGMICAGTGGKDACQGDSGGPLYSGKTLSGIVSWGEGCARPNNPGVYTSIATFRSWIIDNAV